MYRIQKTISRFIVANKLRQKKKMNKITSLPCKKRCIFLLANTYSNKEAEMLEVSKRIRCFAKQRFFGGFSKEDKLSGGETEKSLTFLKF